MISENNLVYRDQYLEHKCLVIQTIDSFNYMHEINVLYTFFKVSFLRT